MTKEKMMKTRNILLDTSIVLDSIDNITNIDKEANVFVTDVVLRELDGNKGAEGAKGYNAREFFRQFNSNEFTALNKIPTTNASLQKDDTLTDGSINSGAHIFTLARKWYRTRD
jgi:predicted ribonuclease YlaK